MKILPLILPLPHTLHTCKTKNENYILLRSVSRKDSTMLVCELFDFTHISKKQMFNVRKSHSFHYRVPQNVI